MKKAFERRFGAREFTFDIDKATGGFLPKVATAVKLDTLSTAVKKAGFKLLWARLTLEGTLVMRTTRKGTKEYLLVARGSEWAVTLVTGKSKAQQTAWRWLVQWAAKGRVSAHIDGRFSSSKGHPLEVSEAKRLVGPRR